ncbi:MAG: hypothetical protein ABI323_04410 [Solirubrobacteraceae bacterium]
MSRGDRARYDERPAERNAREESVFDHFGNEPPASESYRVEVERYWKRTASRRSQAEARQARRVRRFSGEVSKGGERRTEALSTASTASTASADPRLDSWGAEIAPERTSEAAGTNDPYREMLHSWARETAEEFKRPAGSGRRTVTITGHGAEGYASRHGTRASSAERHRQLPRHERSGYQPDRVAMWAVLLGMLMVLAAAASAHAAVIAHHALALH